MTALIRDILSNDGWDELFRFAKRHSILGVVWDEVQDSLTDFGGIPPFTLRQWLTLVGKIEENNKLIDEIAWRISCRFAEDGLPSMILKGQGLARYYPIPHHRQPGDIDIWIWLDQAGLSLSRRRDTITEYVRKIDPNTRTCYHHTSFKRIQGKVIEVHFTPSWMYSPRKNRYLQKYFDIYLLTVSKERPQSGRFRVPSEEFNLVFILIHLYRHVFDEGIGLRQMMDYDMVLRHSSAEDKTTAMRHIRALGLARFAGAVMYVLTEVFGTEPRLLPCEPDEKEGRWLYRQIMEGGNFGRHRPASSRKKSATTAHLHNLGQRVLRSAELLTHYGEEASWAIPWRIWHWVWRRLKGY